MTNRSPASLNPSGSVGVYWGVYQGSNGVGEAGKRHGRRRRGEARLRWSLGWSKSTAPFSSCCGCSGSNSGELLLALLRLEVGEV